MKNYRKFYKDYYNIEFGSKYEVHHIDFNHNNNNIDNLVLLPKELHQEYHTLIQQLQLLENKIKTKITGNMFTPETYCANLMREFLDVLDECNKWYDYKMFLGGILPNIHKIKKEDLL